MHVFSCFFLRFSFLHLSTNPRWLYICVRLSSPQTTARRPKVSSVLQVTCIIWELLLEVERQWSLRLSFSKRGLEWVWRWALDQRLLERWAAVNPAHLPKHHWLLQLYLHLWENCPLLGLLPSRAPARSDAFGHTWLQTQINHCFLGVFLTRICQCVASLPCINFCNVKMSVKVFSCQGHRCCERCCVILRLWSVVTGCCNEEHDSGEYDKNIDSL